MSARLNMLVLGGTSWLGGSVAASALSRGHQVACLARGESGGVPSGATHVRADRWAPSGYDEVAGRAFDAVIDVSWQPELVRSALAALADDTAHWVYVSSVSVYADHSTPGADESAPLAAPWTGSGEVTRAEYPGAKVSCETACREAVPEGRLLVARPGLIVGYGDRSDRFGYWPGRFARAGWDGELLAPPLDTAVQVVDVEDLATWLVTATERRIAGTFDAIGDGHSFSEMVEACSEATGSSPRIVSPEGTWLESEGVEPWAGPESLPLWLPGSHGGMTTRSGQAARAAGLGSRPLRESAADALRWERELGLDRDRQAGLSPAREAELLARWHASS